MKCRKARAGDYRRGRPPSPWGFSLIELLTVIGIIGLLATLLLPTLGQAKNHAQGIKCLSNLKQFNYAWLMYADDHDGRFVPNNPTQMPASPVQNTWVRGWLDPMNFDDWRDNTNMIYLRESLLAPGLASSIGIWRCPADKSMSRHSGQLLPRLRSYSMNRFLNPFDTLGPSGATPPFKMILNLNDMIIPPPAKTLVFIDEREDSIEDCVFGIDVYNGPAALSSLPRNAHNGAGTVSFADGHVERHKWRDPRTTPPIQKRGHIGLTWGTWPPNPDVLWLQERATGLR